MKSREELIKNIIEKYQKDNSDNPEKVFLEKPAIENKDPFFLELKKEIDESIFKKENKKHNKNKKEIIIEKSKENEKFHVKDETLDKKIIDKIETVTKKIIKIINIDLFTYKTVELRELIFEVILKDLVDFKLTETKEQKIIELIDNLLEEEINTYFSKDDKRRNKELLKFFLNVILPEVNLFYIKNSYENMNKLSIFQKQFLINSFIEYLERKYLKKELSKKKITEKEYDFLKSKIKIFIIKQEENYKEINILTRLNKIHEKSQNL
jgi:hypothetical protein